MTSLSNKEENIHNHSRLTIIYLPLAELRISIAFLTFFNKSSNASRTLYFSRFAIFALQKVQQ